MSSLDVIENKISYIQKHISQIESYRTLTMDTLSNDRTMRSAVERELYVIAQAVIDLAEAVVAFKAYRKPTTMREAFDILVENKMLSQEFINRFIGIVGFRNALAHDYEDLHLEVLYDVLQNKIPEVEEFLNILKNKLGI